MRLRLIVRALLALSVVGSVIYGWHWYLIDRFLDRPDWAQGWVDAARWGIVAMAVSMPLSMFMQRGVNPKYARWVGWPASVWMGFAWISFAVLVALEPLRWIWDGMTPQWHAAIAFGVATKAMVWGFFRAMRPRTKVQEVAIDNWPSALDGFEIVQLSDVHIGPILGEGFARRITKRVNAMDPDLVVVTGDLVDGSVRHVGEMVEPLSELRAKEGLYFVTGNHDFYSGADPWCRRVEALGFEVLRNRHLTISREGASFCLAGVDDHRGSPLTGESGEDLEAALAGIPEGRPTVLLAHDPATFRRAQSMGVDLQISGHTHGGQIWPFGYLVRATVKWVAGLYREGRAQIYVSRGTGFWGPPVRIGAPGEITRIRIRRA